MAMSTYLSIIILKVSGLNFPIKIYRGVEWAKIQDPSMCCLQKNYFRAKDTHGLNVKKIFHANGNENKACRAILISDKTDFKRKTVIEDKGHHIIIKGSILPEDSTFKNIHVPNTESPK